MSGSKKAYKPEIFTNTSLFDHAAELIIKIGHEAICKNGYFVIVLSGGKTPEKLYALLASPPWRDKIDWKKIFFFWGDERCVPFHDDRNNAHRAASLLLDHVPVIPHHVHRIPVNLPPEDAALKYQHLIEEFFNDQEKKFDLILLGLGENGHTASLFPGSPVIHEKSAGVRKIFVEEENMFRITMTAPLINMAHHILFLVTGENKANILEKVLKGPHQPDLYPAQLIHPADGDLRWYLDEAAASLIDD